jgi:hypothetical protein
MTPLIPLKFAGSKALFGKTIRKTESLSTGNDGERINIK